jgi:hypothetical protein
MLFGESLSSRLPASRWAHPGSSEDIHGLPKRANYHIGFYPIDSTGLFNPAIRTRADIHHNMDTIALAYDYLDTHCNAYTDPDTDRDPDINRYPDANRDTGSL